LRRVDRVVHDFPRMSAVAAAAAAILAATVLAACNMLTGNGDNASPDALDRVRAADLQPRFPQPAPGANTGTSGGPRATSYFGSGVPAAAEAPPGATASGADGFELNFENTPVTTVAKVILGDILGLGYTIDPRVQGTVSLTSGRPIARTDILFVLESALRTSNVALVRDTAGYRLIPGGDAVGGGSLDRTAGGAEPGYGLSVLPLRHVAAATLIKLLDSFAMKAGTVRADPARNLLMVQGSGGERRAAIDTVLSFDVDWMRGQSVGIYPVRNTTPEPVIAELEKIMDAGEGGLSQGLVKLQAVARLNAILVVTKRPELLRTTATWITRLDASSTASTGVKVYRVRHGDARHIARLLNDIFLGGGGGGGLDTATNQLAPGGGATTLSSPDKLTGGMASLGTAAASGAGSGLAGSGLGNGGRRAAALGAPAGATDLPPGGDLAPGAGGNGLGSSVGRPGGAVLPGVRITADVANNALLIYANQESYQIIERTLNQLDRPQLQVAFDATIAEVTLNDDLNYGVQFYLESGDLGLKADKGSIINSAAGAVLAQALPGFNFLIGPNASPRLIISALHGVTDVKVLSNPSLVVLDNQVATLQVGDQVPVATGTATVLSANNAVVNTVDYRNTGIILRVVPRISSNGNVMLDIEQEISNVADNTAAGTLTPTLAQRRVRSSLSVASGQTVLLAGLISETQNRSRSGIPLLDQVPGLGVLASQNKKKIQRTELIIFIRPQIIRDSVDASFVAEELRSKLRGSEFGGLEPAVRPVARPPAVR
jgi:general secretion pathway protein D